jgi:hypothetical protein
MTHSDQSKFELKHLIEGRKIVSLDFDADPAGHVTAVIFNLDDGSWVHCSVQNILGSFDKEFSLEHWTGPLSARKI